MRKLFVALLCSLSTLAAAQTLPGTVSGRILDPAGNVVPHAAITLRNALNGFAQHTESNVGGTYSFSHAAGGEYLLTVSAEGFAPQTRSVAVKQGVSEVHIDIRLVPASVRQSVTVVSGSRVEELQQDSPLPIDVKTRQQMARTGFENVADVLSELPGIVTRNNSSFSGASGEQIDGIASQDILVLEDGLPIAGARGIKSGIIDLDQQNIGRLDRVEAVRGAASSLYGTDAVGGVINMITHVPRHPFEAGLRLSGGTLGLFDGDLDLGTKLNKFSAFTDLELHRIGSYTLLPEDESTIGADARRYDGLLKLKYGSFSSVILCSRETKPVYPIWPSNDPNVP